MALAASTRLGPYEILEPLGAGGMGEVYRAHDPRLGRDVAIKVLPAAFSADPDRLRRFEQEARAAAGLNHPNILAVHDIGTHEDQPYVVSELLEGQTLRETLTGGALPVKKAIDYAIQIAQGLAAAHEKAIVHRDLKPENLFVTKDNRVKILDFGLAKLTEVPVIGAGASMLVTRNVETTPGLVMGSVGYMSPEQVRGATADHRSDIFSFGLVLHEMLSGKRAFQSDTSAETMTAILKQDPPALPETVPAAVRQIVGYCLEKDPTHRFQSARDLSLALGAVAQSSSHSGKAVAVTQPSHRARRVLLPAAAIAILALGVFIGRVFWRSPAQPSWTGVMLGGPELSYNPRPSPDGHLVAFVGKDPDDLMQIWVMRPESRNRIMLTHDRARGYAQACSWSADGSRIYYDRWYDQPKGVFSIPALGGDEQLVLEDAISPEALPDGSLLLVRINPEHRYQWFRYWPDTGQLQAYAVEWNHLGFAAARVIPGGHQALVPGTRMEPGAEAADHPYVVDLASGNMRRLAGESTSEYTAFAVTRDGRDALISSPHGSMSRVAALPLDGHGPSRTLLTLTHPVYSLDTGPEGSIYLDQNDRPHDLVRFSAEGGRVERIATVVAVAEPYSSDIFAVLPDGRAVWSEPAAGHSRLIVVEPGKEPVPLVNTTEETAPPMTSAGAGEVAFMIGPSPRHMIALAALSNGRITRRLSFDKGLVTGMAASPDGKILYCVAAGAVWAVPVTGETPHKIRTGNGVAIDAGTQSLVIDVREPPNVRLFRIPLSGGAEQELSGPFRLGGDVDPGSIRNRRLVAPLASPYWYWPPGMFDLSAGQSARIPLEYTGDFHHLAWTPDGKIMAVAAGWHSTLWKFTPEAR